MEPWNKDYILEAQCIASQVVREWGQPWAAEQIERGRRNHIPEVQIAMRALMVARGEHKLPKPYF